MKIDDDKIMNFNNVSVGVGENAKDYSSFNALLKEKQIRFGWDIYMNYDYEYVKYKDIVMEYYIVIKENNKLYELKGEKKLHRNMRRVRTYPIFGV
jgi:hypothetical protein